MTRDSKIQHDVMTELAWEPSIDEAEIGVTVHDGVVTLSGFVTSFPEKAAAEHAATRVAGVKAIVEELKVRFSTATQSSDVEIAKRIASIFEWDPSIPDSRINVKVEHGWVTLSGKVAWHFQSDAARKAAGRVQGVLGVSNLIEVAQPASAADVRQKITAAFERQADLDAAAISVRTDGGTVTLSGQVKAWSERRIAERAAWAAPGVTKVDDQLRVA
ncbi:MAG: BON domain-containing protein [Sphingomonas sp.]|uniref:BON domain-containing protein n=1 Tax=Sphingomonas sp. TaxID=28214 RepID=UPI0035657EC1